ADLTVLDPETAEDGQRSSTPPRRALIDFRRMSYAVAATDAVSVLLAVLAARILRSGLELPSSLPLASLLAPLVVIAVFAQLRLYDLRNLASGEEVRRLILGISAVIVGIPTILLWIHRGGFSRAWVGVTWAFSVGLVLLSRRLWHVAVRRARARGKLTFRTLVVGTSAEAAHLVQVLRSKPVGYDPIGLVSAGHPNGKRSHLPVLGSLADLEPILSETQADCIFVVSGAVGEEELARMTRIARLADIELRVASSLPQLRMSRISMQPIGGFVSLCVRRMQLTKSAAVTKRAVDVIGSAVAL